MKKILLLVWCAGIMMPLVAQEASQDTSFLQASVTNVKKVLSKSKLIQPHLYNGVAYVEPRLTDIDQFPYFMLNDWTIGSIVYDGEQYDDIAMMYDIHNDDVIIEIQNGTRVKLIREKTTAFDVFDRHFVKLLAVPKPGFYALLYSGSTKVYARFEKNRQERIESNAVKVEFEKRTRYYILKDGIFNSVKSKADVLKVYNNKKRDLKQLAQKNHLQFNKNREQSIIKLATFYDTIQP